MLRRRFQARIATLLLLTLTWNAALADPVLVDDQVKAAFLYKFGAFVEWPAQAFERPDSPFVIGVAGPDAFADLLTQTTNGHTMNGRPVEIHRLRRGDPVTGLHIMFVTREHISTLSETLAAAKGQPILTVTDGEKSPSQGAGIINFVLESNRVRFDITLEPAEQSGLKISARLLTVARKVIGRPS